MRRALPLAAALLAVAPGVAHGDGLPIGNLDVGKEGVVAPGAPDRIVTLPAGRSTIVARVERDGGRVERFLRLRERLTVPAVALDGTTDGRSADGRIAVLLRPRPVGSYARRARSRFVVLGVRPLRVRRRITLRGDFSFDALSPDGRRMYLIEYVSARDPSRYVVRSYDLRRGRLERGAVIDAREPEERMAGFPVTRATSADGRWAYTLYTAEEPFVHALDTVRRAAFCIDLPWLGASEAPLAMRLRIDDGSLAVLDLGDVAASIDTRTMEASERVVVAPARPDRRPAAASEGGPDWWLAGVLAAFGFVAIAGARAVRRSRTTR